MKIIEYTDLLKIADGFQVASGQTYAIEKTKSLLDYIRTGQSILVNNFNYSKDSKRISSVDELVDVFKSIDQYIDLRQGSELKEYF